MRCFSARRTMRSSPARRDWRCPIKIGVWQTVRIGIITIRARTGEEGGAGRFYDGLPPAFLERGYAVEPVTIPSDETTFDAIEETYLRCYEFDAGAFDAVISTKAPSYLVRHPNHVCYLVHTIRVFYDMFESAFPSPGGR